MSIFTILAWIIITIISFLLFPFMTIGVIFLGAGMNILAIIFLVLGMAHGVYKLVIILEN